MITGLVTKPVSVNRNRIACFFSTSGHSGVDRAMQHLIPALTERGYGVDLLHVRKHGPYIKAPPAGMRLIDLGTRHTYLSVFAVARYLRRERPVVMLSDKDRVNRTALLARFLANVPTRLVLSSGTTISIDLASRGGLERWIQRHSMGKLYPLADKVIVTSKGVADDMAAYTGLARRHIDVVPSPVVSQRLFVEPQPRPPHPWFAAGQPPVVLGVGELGKRKDFATLMRAFALVRRRYPCRLVILGEGRQRQSLQALAVELGLHEDVDLPGYQNPYPYMAHAAVFVLSSRWEGLGFVLIEALAVGTPVVATDCPSGPREILQDGRYGPLVNVADSEALAGAILSVLERPLPAATLREAALSYEIEYSTTAYLAAMGLPPEAG